MLGFPLELRFDGPSRVQVDKKRLPRDLATWCCVSMIALVGWDRSHVLAKGRYNVKTAASRFRVDGIRILHRRVHPDRACRAHR